MYGFTTTLTGLSFDDAPAKTTAALKAEGFGVLSDIDVQRAMKEKLGADMLPYRILGACNPPLAHKALQTEPDIGLLLPCNVIVREEAPGRVVVGFLDPQTMVGLVGKPEVKTVADDAESRLRRVCDALGAELRGQTEYAHTARGVWWCSTGTRSPGSLTSSTKAGRAAGSRCSPKGLIPPGVFRRNCKRFTANG